MSMVDPDLSVFAVDRGLTVHIPSPHHVQLREDGKVFVDWWPGKGTTMLAGIRGPACKTSAALIEWLKSL